MGMFDALRGRLSDDTSSVSAPSISTPELESGDRAGAVDIASTSAAAAGIELPAGERLYNPYEGFAAAVDGRGMRGQYRLPAQPEFLFAEEAAVHRRSWSENLTYYTGVGYLAGAGVGGARGAAAALKGGSSAAAPAAASFAGVGGASTSVPPPPPSSSTRLLINRVLNSSGRSGRGAANTLGALGLLFAAAESAADAAWDGRGPEAVPPLLAGFASGALFRSPRGPRAAVVAGAVGAVAASGLVAARAFISRDL